MRQIINHLTDNDAYTFSCQYYVLQTYPRAEVEYTFFDRNGTIYPKGFGELVKEQIGLMPHVMITEEEIAFMKRRMYYLPEWYFTFLRGYRFDPHEVSVSQDILTSPFAANGTLQLCGRCPYSPSFRN